MPKMRQYTERSWKNIHGGQEESNAGLLEGEIVTVGLLLINYKFLEYLADVIEKLVGKVLARRRGIVV